VAAGTYEKALAAIVVNLKRVPHLPTRAAELLRFATKRMEIGDPAIVVPIPLSKLRLLERGYNQAEILAREVGSASNLQVIPAALVRKRQTPMHRVAMDKKAREMTVEKAFEVRGKRMIDGKEVVLVDDVFTSGATASACALLLKKNGARRVTVLTLARAVMYK
jgi:ComF family protein